MKVKDLIKLLESQDQDRIVIVAKDSEGNDYSPLSCVETTAYLAETTYSGQVGLELKDLTPEMIKEGFSEEDVLSDGVPALVLVPIN